MLNPCRNAEGEYVLPVGVGTEELKIDITVENKNEDAHESMLYVFLPENLDYIGTTNEVSCRFQLGLISILRQITSAGLRYRRHRQLPRGGLSQRSADES